MVILRKKLIDGNEYYYLEHSIKKKKHVIKKEKYLGKSVPKNIEKIKQEFLSEIFEENLFNSFEKVRKNFKEKQGEITRSVKEKEIETFMIKFTYDTQKIEGSKLTLRETANLLENGITPKERPIRDIKEAEAHKKIFYNMLEYKENLSMRMILYWHKRLFENTKPDIAGRIRNHQVAISGSKFMPPFPAELNILLEEFFDWYNKNKKTLNPVKLAALVHLKFVTIHPFNDGNGRISRLLMNFVLKKYGFPMLDIPYENRNSYYNALERSQVRKEEWTFLRWFFKKYLKEFKRYL